jgi:hypothetical protein
VSSGVLRLSFRLLARVRARQKGARGLPGPGPWCVPVSRSLPSGVSGRVKDRAEPGRGSNAAGVLEAGRPRFRESGVTPVVARMRPPQRRVGR